jgi:hypothetical protein
MPSLEKFHEAISSKLPTDGKRIYNYRLSWAQ